MSKRTSGQGAVRDLHEQRDVLGAWMAEKEPVVTRPCQHEIWLRFGVGADENRVLHPHHDIGTGELDEHPVEPVHESGVHRTARRHPDNLPVEQLHTVILAENPRQAHPLVLADGEPPSRHLDPGDPGLRAHTTILTLRSSQQLLADPPPCARRGYRPARSETGDEVATLHVGRGALHGGDVLASHPVGPAALLGSAARPLGDVPQAGVAASRR
ncbi:MAG: hypothetical protein WD250_07185 [Egibacteraceae bacterium]